MTKIVEAYDEKYRTENYFGDRLWLYRPYVRALVRKAGLGRGSRLIDAGCGQGFFTSLFAEQGIDALGVDISPVGIAAARTAYGSSRARFEVGDVLSLPQEGQFDCVFTRSCSLYNTDAFPIDTGVTDRLMRYLRPGGIFIFDYYSRLSDRAHADGWRYHSVEAVKRHFKKYDHAKVYFSLRVETRILGAWAFSPVTSSGAHLFSRLTGVGGELVALVRRT